MSDDSDCQTGKNRAKIHFFSCNQKLQIISLCIVSKNLIIHKNTQIINYLFLKLKQLELEKPLYFDPFDQNNINHLVQVSLEIFLCRFENSSPGARGNNKIYINE